MTDVSLCEIVNSCSHLQSINLVGCPNITDLSLTHMSKQLAMELQSLKLNGMNNITNTSIYSIIEQCKYLTELDMSWCRIMNDEVIEKILSCCAKLKKITLWGCSQVCILFQFCFENILCYYHICIDMLMQITDVGVAWLLRKGVQVFGKDQMFLTE